MESVTNSTRLRIAHGTWVTAATVHFSVIGDVGFQQDLRDGVCQEQCNNAECQFDGGDCVLLTQGSCNSGCFPSMLGNSHCDPVCETSECQYDGGDCSPTFCSPDCPPSLLGNGHCDTACHLPACNWDYFDCDCSPGCTAALLANSVCDTECEYPDCGFDGNLCVRDSQGDCSAGCFAAMVADGHCDLECNNAQCEWDALDCGCAPGCSFSDLQTCKAECMVADCNYSALPGYPACTDQMLRLASKYYQIMLSTWYKFIPNVAYDYSAICPRDSYCSLDLWKQSFSECLPGRECKDPECLSHFGNCISTPNCEAAYTTQSGFTYCFRCPSQEYNSAGFCDSTCAPGLVPHPLVPDLCVFEADPTTETNPEVIYVSAFDTGSDPDGSFARPFTDISQALNHTRRRFTAIYLVGTSFRLEANVQSILYQNITESVPLRSFRDRQHSLTISPLACGDSHTLCQRPTLYLNYQKMGRLVAPGLTRAYDRCSGLIDFGVLELTNLNIEGAGVFPWLYQSVLLLAGVNRLVLTNVTIANVHGLESIIQFDMWTSLLFTNVSFLNVSAVHAIVYQSNPETVLCSRESVWNWTYPSNFTYIGGEVEMMVSGQNKASAFLQGLNMREVAISGVTFQGRSTGQGQFSYAYLDVCHHFSLRNCEFRNNAMLFGYFLHVKAVNWDYYFENAPRFQSANSTNYQIVDCVFANNSVSYGAVLYFAFPSISQNVLVSNCTFWHENAVSIAAFNSNFVNKTRIVGDGRFVSSGKRLDYAPNSIRIENVIFEDCEPAGESHILMDKMTYVDITNFTVTFSAARSDRCPSILLITSSYNVTLSAFVLSDFHCQPGRFLLTVHNSSGLLTLDRFRLANSTGDGVKGVLVSLNSLDEVKVLNTLVEHCSNSAPTGQGILYLSGINSSATIEHSTFRHNTASIAGAISANGLSALVLINATFDHNSAQSAYGGALSVAFDSLTYVSVNIDSSLFKGNQAETKGGAVHIGYSTSLLSLIVTNSVFTENLSDSGSGLYLSTGLEIAGSSHISETVFQRNFGSAEGVLALHYSKGRLCVIGGRIEDNIGTFEAVVSARYGEGVGASLDMVSVLLRNNSAAAVVLVPAQASPTVFTGTNLTFASNPCVCLWIDSADVTLSACTFFANNAKLSPAIFSKQSEVRVFSTNFTGNTATNYAGAVLVSELAYFLCAQCVFENNSAGTDGGAVYVEQQGVLDLSASVFVGNRVGSSGSALYFLMSSNHSKADGSEFRANKAGKDGVIALFSSLFLMQNCSLWANEGGIMTGGVVITLSRLVAVGCSFGGQTGFAGSLVYISTLSTATLSSCLFSASSSSLGAIYVESSSLHLVHSYFSQLFAQQGSLLYAYNDASASLVNCSADGLRTVAGGAVHCVQSKCALDGFQIADYQSSAVFARQADILIYNSEFRGKGYADGTGTVGTGIHCGWCSTLVVSNTAFRRLQGETGAAVSLESGPTSSLLRIEASVFEQQVAEEGGAILADGVALRVNETQFLGNSARLRGGAVLLICQSQRTNCSFSVAFSVFSQNAAGKLGGAVCWDTVQPVLTQNSYQGNLAPYGGNVASFAVRLYSANASLVRVAPGQRVTVPLQFTLLDHYNNTVDTDNSSKAEMSPMYDSDVLVLGTSVVRADGGRVVFDRLVINASPGSSIRLLAGLVGGQSPLYVNVSIRLCEAGEAELNNQCIPCEPGTYSLTPAQSCRECPPEAVCRGNFSMSPRPGYWRAGPLEMTFFPCPNPSACVGGMELTGSCAEGYYGNMCQTCMAGYHRTSKTTCTDCMSLEASIAKTIGFLCGMSLFSFLLAKASIRSAYRTKSLHSVYLKSFLNYVQLVMLIGSFDFNWPHLSRRLLDFQDQVGGFLEQLLAFDCMKHDYSENEEFYTKLVLVSFTPAFCVLVSSAVWVFIAVRKRSMSLLKNELVSSGVVMFFLIHPSVCRVMFSIFNCEEILPGELWVTGLHLRCWQGDHWKYSMGAALPSLIVWGFGVPAIVLLTLVIQRKHLADLELKIRYGYLFNGYARVKFYWEFVIIYRKLIIICIAVFLARIPKVVQGLLALLVLGMALYFQEEHLPFSKVSLNILEQQSLLVAIVTLFSGLYFLDESLTYWLQVTFFVIILLANAVFLQYWVRKATRSWLVLLMTHVPCLQRCLRIVSETNITFRRSNVPSAESLLHNLHEPQIPEFIKRVYMAKLCAQANNTARE